MTLRNTVKLIGHIGMDPVHELINDTPKCSCSIATSENWKDANGEWKTKTFWHNLIAWGTKANSLSEFINKGDEVMIEGSLETHSYTSQSGERKNYTQIVVREFLILNKKSK